MLVSWSKTTSKIAASVLVIVNAVTMVLAALSFAIGLWLIASPNTFINVIQTFGSAHMKVLLTEERLTLHLAIGVAVVSAFVFFISLMGLYGAIACSQFLLFMYSTLVLLLLLLECALMFYFSSGIVENGLNERDGEWIHTLRLAFKCCDKNVTSQNMNTIYLPWSCCGVQVYPSNCTASKSFRNDCQQTFTQWLDVYGTPIYVCVALFHVVLSSLSLLRRSRSASRLPT